MFSKNLKRFEHLKFEVTTLEDNKEIKPVEAKSKEQLMDEENITLN